MGNALVGRLDQWMGDGIEATVRLKHRRRLAKLGWERVFEPSSPGVFAQGEPPPREGCELQVLIDGANALPEMAQAIGEAKEFVHITGWHLAPAFELVRDRPHGAIGVLLAEMAERVDVRVLVWSGAPGSAVSPHPATRSPRPSRTSPGTRGSRPTATPRSTPSTAITRRRS